RFLVRTAWEERFNPPGRQLVVFISGRNIPSEHYGLSQNSKGAFASLNSPDIPNRHHTRSEANILLDSPASLLTACYGVLIEIFRQRHTAPGAHRSLPSLSLGPLLCTSSAMWPARPSFCSTTAGSQPGAFICAVSSSAVFTPLIQVVRCGSSPTERMRNSFQSPGFQARRKSSTGAA